MVKKRLYQFNVKLKLWTWKCAKRENVSSAALLAPHWLHTSLTISSSTQNNIIIIMILPDKNNHVIYMTWLLVL